MQDGQVVRSIENQTEQQQNPEIATPIKMGSRRRGTEIKRQKGRERKREREMHERTCTRPISRRRDVIYVYLLPASPTLGERSLFAD